MKLFLSLSSIPFLFSPLLAVAQYYPEKEFPELFKAVETTGVFSDSKIFADAIPVKSAQHINKSYQKLKNKKTFELREFVQENFILQKNVKSVSDSTRLSLPEHIKNLWMQLERQPALVNNGSLLPLPFPYTVPGGRFNELYYWDSYFTMLGLQISGNSEQVKLMADNFSYLIDRYGFIPNGNRSYYLSRSQPPFFSLMVDLIAKQENKDTYVRYLPQLLKEYEFWMNGAEKLTPENKSYKHVVRMDDQVILNRYWDDLNTPRPESFREDWQLGNGRDSSMLYRNVRAACESGWDFSSRWLSDGISLNTIHTTDLIPVDLNCLLYHLEYTIAQSYLISGDVIHSNIYTHKAKLRKFAILKYCWNNSLGFFTDYDFVKGKESEVLSLAGVFPLFFNLAFPDQAKLVTEVVNKYFLYEGGLVTTLLFTHQQWDAPNGWAPLQYFGYESMKQYGNQSIADTIAKRWMRTVENTYRLTGKVLEKYNVLYPSIAGGGGEYPTQDGFGWTNAVYIYFDRELETEK